VRFIAGPLHGKIFPRGHYREQVLNEPPSRLAALGSEDLAAKKELAISAAGASQDALGLSVGQLRGKALPLNPMAHQPLQS